MVDKAINEVTISESGMYCIYNVKNDTSTFAFVCKENYHCEHIKQIWRIINDKIASEDLIKLRS